jgi:hypothetical protein
MRSPRVVCHAMPAGSIDLIGPDEWVAHRLGRPGPPPTWRFGRRRAPPPRLVERLLLGEAEAALLERGGP